MQSKNNLLICIGFWPEIYIIFISLFQLLSISIRKYYLFYYMTHLRPFQYARIHEYEYHCLGMAHLDQHENNYCNVPYILYRACSSYYYLFILLHLITAAAARRFLSGAGFDVGLT